MENAWSEEDAQAAVERYTKRGVPLDLALRAYSSQLLGREPKLVMHGGGNTSVKTTMRDLTGDEVEVLCVKGSGWDMATIEPEGLPAVRLAPLRRLAALPTLSDEAMVNALRCNLLRADAPTPSVETLLHAFLPHKFIDHTHANAILALSDQPNGELLCRQLFGDRVCYIPYIMPGFSLAHKALETFAAHSSVDGMLLLKHGIFTFGETARQAYERMIELVTMAEQRIHEASRVSVAGMHLPKGIGRSWPKSFASIRLPTRLADIGQVAPLLRGIAAEACGDGEFRRWIVGFRRGPAIEAFVNGKDLARYAQQGPATPDHIIRTKAKTLLLPPPPADGLDRFAEAAKAAMAAFRADYQAYFQRNNARVGNSRTPLDPTPRVIAVPGLGFFTLGASKSAAEIVGDVAETTVDVIIGAETLDRYEALGEADLFDMEYWSLEQAKLGRAKEKPLARHVVAVTGGASGIGEATAVAFHEEGAEVAVIDIDATRATAVADSIDGLAVACDVTDAADVERAFRRVIEAYGGVDIVVSNAGAAWQGRIGEVDESLLRKSVELNFWSHQIVARAAVQIFQIQSTGGVLLFNASKQAVNPGPDFGPYGLPKAATLALMRQYAVDYGREGIRSCAVNADRVRTGLLTQALVESRAKARGISEDEYLRGNILGREVLASDVARAFVDLAKATKTTGAVLTVDGGNIAAALR